LIILHGSLTSISDSYRDDDAELRQRVSWAGSGELVKRKQRQVLMYSLYCTLLSTGE